MPARARKTSAATISPRIFMVRNWLSTLPPNGHTTNHYQEGQQELAGDAYPIQLRAGHRDAPIFLFLGANGDQVFVGRKPVYSVQREIIVSVKVDKPIGGP